MMKNLRPLIDLYLSGAAIACPARGEACLCVNMVGVASGFYMRSLPSPPAIDFTSSPGKKLFTEALYNGTMEGFFKLISLFQTQSEPAYCGLATLAMVLNALSIDPCRKWKGPWRWFDETMLDWCEPLEKVKVEGISFGKLICLASCAGANVIAFRTNQSCINKFRKLVMACSTSDDCHLILSYDRRAFKQTGTGHFSPIGGYHAESDMVLILDVARFKYPPHWVPLSLLWEAMDTVDEATGLKRGFMVVSRMHRSTVLQNLCCKHDTLISAAKYLTEDAPLLLSSDNLKDVNMVISAIFFSLPSDFKLFIQCVEVVHRNEWVGHAQSLEHNGSVIKEQVRETRLFKYVTDTFESSSNFLCKRDCFTELLLSLPPETWSAIKDEKVFNEISSLVILDSLPSLLQDEVLHIRGQLLVLKGCYKDLILP